MTRSAEPGTRARLWLLGIVCFAVLLAGGTVGFILSRSAHGAVSARALP